MSVEQAEDACQRFLSDAMESGYHTVQIIHGKGASPTQALLKSHLNAWLRADPHVNAFSSCPSKAGGTGAVFVAIRQKKGQDWY